MMMAIKPAAAMALAALYSKDSRMVERSFHYLTNPTLQDLKERLHSELALAEVEAIVEEQDLDAVLALGCLRWIAYRGFQKYSTIASSEVMETALKYYTLPTNLQQDVLSRHSTDNTSNTSTPPTTWYEALEQLKSRTANNTGALWRLILDHPMTAYVPVQCQKCGHVLPDDTHTNSPEDDAMVGLNELDPTGEELELRAGWFRGPRGPKVFQLTCPSCQHVSQWYRSGHPSIILNPNKWGRLCGEQEELRLHLAHYLGIPLRTIVPLDWDHVWSEYQDDNKIEHYNIDDAPHQHYWQVQDDSARNFACRLDEGIGAWTGVLALHPNPDFCQDVTTEYLACQDDNNGGRADKCHQAKMLHYRDTVHQARQDASGAKTQAKTVNGYLLQRAGMTSQDITLALRQAAKDYRENKPWWNVQ